MKRSINDRGFSLIEVLVATSVIVLSLFAVVAFMRKGHEIITIQKHRAMARGIVQKELEKPPYQPEYYNTLTTTSFGPADVVLDAATNLHGWFTLSVGSEQLTVNGIDAPYRAVTATITWTEPDGNNDTVTITKWLADVQRD